MSHFFLPNSFGTKTFIYEEYILQFSSISNLSSHHHHHHVTLLARISLTLSRQPSLLSIAPERSSSQHLSSAQSCCIYDLAGCPNFDCPCAGGHRSKSLISSSLLLQQNPASLIRLIWIVFGMSGRWPYRSSLVVCFLPVFLNMAHSILL